MEKYFTIRNGRANLASTKNFSTCPLGTVLSFAGQTAPRGFLLCDGASYPTTEYPDLYAVIGNTYGGDTENFNVPDYRETVLVGVGENTTDTIASHDVYELGEFKDDQMQSHKHTLSIPDSVYQYTPTFSNGPGSNSKYTAATSNNSGRSGATTHGKQKGVTYIIKAFHTNEGVDTNEVTDQIIEYVEGEIDGLIDNTTSSETSTWSSSMIASQINNATAIKRSDVIAANATKETGWNLVQEESHFYGRLLQLDGHLGSKSSTFSFLLFVKANYDNPTTVYATQLAGMDDDRSNIAHTTYFELGVSSDGNLTIKNKSAVAASYRFI